MAIVVYAVIGWGLVTLIRITAPRGTRPATPHDLRSGEAME